MRPVSRQREVPRGERPRQVARAMVAAARGDRATVRHLTDDLVTWSAPNRIAFVLRLAAQPSTLWATERSGPPTATRSRSAHQRRCSPAHPRRCGFCSTSSRRPPSAPGGRQKRPPIGQLTGSLRLAECQATAGELTGRACLDYRHQVAPAMDPTLDVVEWVQLLAMPCLSRLAEVPGDGITGSVMPTGLRLPWVDARGAEPAAVTARRDSEVAAEDPSHRLGEPKPARRATDSWLSSPVTRRSLAASSRVCST